MQSCARCGTLEGLTCCTGPTMPAPLLLRPFDIDDHATALALWQRTPGVGLSAADEAPALRAYLLRNPGTSFVAERDGTVVGTVLCGHDGRRGLIHHLVTDPAARRQGVARQLVQRALATLHAQGIGKCHLMVFADNADGLAFWAAIGGQLRDELALVSLTTG